MKLYLAEKPAQGRDLARALGGPPQGNGCIETPAGVVTWAVGHLLELVEPEDYDPKWKDRYNFATLPILPEQMRLAANPKTASQLKFIGQLLRQADEVVIATDPDRQGEAIARNVLDHFGYRGKLSRLWFRGLDAKNIQNALDHPKADRETAPLATVARALSEADWLYGMNGSRGVGAKVGGWASLGRVQTPTLALIVWRDRQIREFKVRNYFDLVAKVQPSSGGEPITLTHSPKEEARILEREKAEAHAAQARGQETALRFSQEPKSEPPPKLFSITTLSKAANATFGWTAKKTLEIAQALYETQKATTYPRTNCEFLPSEQEPEALDIAAHLLQLDPFVGLGKVPLATRKSVYDTSKVEAHHAIVPLSTRADLGAMSSDERKLYLLVASRFLASLMPNYEYLSTKIEANIPEASGLLFIATGVVRKAAGWKAAVDALRNKSDDDEQEALLPALSPGERGRVVSCTVDAKKTKPPAHYTDATLLDDMEHIGKYVENPEQQALLRSKEGKYGSADKGIGTGATRPDIIARIIKKAQAVYDGKKIVASPEGHKLIEFLERNLPQAVDLGSTAVLEMKLNAIAAGEATAADFDREFRDSIRQMIGTLGRHESVAHGAGTAKGEPTGVQVKGVEIQKCTDAENKGRVFYLIPGMVKGRLYGEKWGHSFSADEIRVLVEGGEITATDCKSYKTGAALGPKRFRFDPNLKPYPDIVAIDETQREATNVTVGAKGKGGVVRCTTTTGKVYYTVEKLTAGGFPVRFWEEAMGRKWAPEEIAVIVAAGAEGAEFNGFTRSADGSVYSARVWYNPKRKDRSGTLSPGLDFKS